MAKFELSDEDRRATGKMWLKCKILENMGEGDRRAFLIGLRAGLMTAYGMTKEEERTKEEIGKALGIGTMIVNAEIAESKP